jgi:hypothetical protein
MLDPDPLVPPDHHGARGLGVSDHGRDAYLEEVARILVERNNQLWRAG